MRTEIKITQKLKSKSQFAGTFLRKFAQKVEHKPAHTCEHKYVRPQGLHRYAHAPHMVPPERRQAQIHTQMHVEDRALVRDQLLKQMRTPLAHNFSHKLEQLHSHCAEIGTQIRGQIDAQICTWQAIYHK